MPTGYRWLPTKVWGKGGGGQAKPPGGGAPVHTHWWRGNAKLSRGHFCQKGKVEGVT